MTEANIELVRSIYDAFESHDLDGVLSHMDEDVEVVASEGLPWSGTYYGKDGFADFLATIEDHVRLAIETEELYASGESVAQIGRSIAEVHSTGVSFDTRAIHIWRLRNGKVTSFQNYPDTEAQRRVLGLTDEDEPSGADKPNPEPFWG